MYGAEHSVRVPLQWSSSMLAQRQWTSHVMLRALDSWASSESLLSVTCLTGVAVHQLQ